ncbi:MAG: hypothetical protein AAFX06_19330 [Planctomycetota bacterium]
MLPKDVADLRARDTVELQELSDRLRSEAAGFPESEERQELIRWTNLVVDELVRRTENRHRSRHRSRARLT